ncbi:MAG: C-terminal binding protein [Desulfobacterales bacterium]|nr:MAG: C-terminal binding protein [Desulfobacterales bacterium]
MSGNKVVIQKFTSRMQSVWGEALYIERETFDQGGVNLVEVEAESEDAYIQSVKDADAILSHGGGIVISKRIIDSLQNCRIIALPSVGFDSVDIAAATARNIWVTNTPDVFIEEVADHTMMLLLASWRRLITQDDMVRTGRWIEARPMLNQFPRLYGQTLGFIAFGNIPRAVARRAKPFGLNLLAFDPYIHELEMIQYDVEPVARLSELLARADLVSAHLPLSEETYKMIAEAEFKQMKSTAIFLNTGRGNTVDEAALIKALQEDWIAFAGLDVFEKEPIEPDNPLLTMENVILTAHAASASARMPVEARRRAAREVVRVLQGQKPVSPVNDISPPPKVV